MTLLEPPDSPYPIANLRMLLNDRAGIDLSPIELVEILWLALQQGVTVPNSPSSQRSPEEAGQEQELPPPDKTANTQANFPTAAVVAEPPPTGSQTAGTALALNVPEAIALRNRRAISHSLRPLMRRVPSRVRQSLDEEATATQSAEIQTWNPVVRPDQERWLELAIVIEATNLLEVWRDTIAEFQHLMERHGAFRNVRTWQLKPDAAGEPRLFLQTSSGLKGNARSPKELLDAGRRRLVLLLSDCTSTAWRSGKILHLMELWSRENPVTLVQLLPERYWDRTALKLGYPVALRSRLPGALSRDWAIDGLSPRRRRQLPGGLKLPVVTMQPRSLTRWAKAIAAIGEQQTTGIVLTSASSQPDGSGHLAEDWANPAGESLTAKALVQRFRATASAEAQALVDRMAVLPVNWSVIRLIQKNWVQDTANSSQETGALHLAEIFLSGLLTPVSMVAEPSQKMETIQQYDFVAGVRDVLLGTIPISEAQDVGEQIAEVVFKQLPLEVQHQVAADIEQRFGTSLSCFEAFLIPDLPWGEHAAAEILPFARVTGEVLRRWGGDYAALAVELEQIATEGRQLTSAIQHGVNLRSSDQLSPDAQKSLLDDEQAVNSTMTADEALRWVEGLLSQQGKQLSDLERIVFLGSWEGKGYDAIHQEFGFRCSLDHLKRNVGYQLWKSLTEVLGQKVLKNTLQSCVIQAWQMADASPPDVQKPILGQSYSHRDFTTDELSPDVKKGLLDDEQAVNSTMDAEDALRWVEEVLFHKGKQLSDLERIVFLGSWDGKGYDAIHQDCGFRCSLDNLKRNVGYQLWKRLTEVLGQKVLKNTLQGRVMQAQQQWQNSQGGTSEGDAEPDSATLSSSPDHASAYRSEQPNALPANQPDELMLPETKVDWGDAPLARPFYGRTNTLNLLGKKIRLNLCKLISFYGISGIGKTALTLQLVLQVEDQFEFVIWRSLHHAPPLADLLADLNRHFSKQQVSSSDLSQLMHYMVNHRCLVILDGLDAVLRAGVHDSSYQEGYEDYDELLRQVGMTSHESCLIVTGRENPKVISEMGDNPQAAYYTSLPGLGVGEARELFTARGCDGSNREWRELIRRYWGHPLVLNAIAIDVRNMFQGNTAQFLEQVSPILPETLWPRLAQQLARLSQKEQLVVHCLQTAADPVSITALQTALKPQMSEAELMPVLRSLMRRALIEANTPGYTLQRLVMEYLNQVSG